MHSWLLSGRGSYQSAPTSYWMWECWPSVGTFSTKIEISIFLNVKPPVFKTMETKIIKTLYIPNKTHLQANSVSCNWAVLDSCMYRVSKVCPKLTTHFAGWSYKKLTKGPSKSNYYVSTESWRYNKPDLPSWTQEEKEWLLCTIGLGFKEKVELLGQREDWIWSDISIGLLSKLICHSFDKISETDCRATWSSGFRQSSSKKKENKTLLMSIIKPGTCC